MELSSEQSFLVAEFSPFDEALIFSDKEDGKTGREWTF